MVQRFEGLVREIEPMPRVDVAVIGRRGQQHVGHLPRIGPGADRRNDAPFGPFGIADVDKLPKPAFQRRQIG